MAILTVECKGGSFYQFEVGSDFDVMDTVIELVQNKAQWFALQNTAIKVDIIESMTVKEPKEAE